MFSVVIVLIACMLPITAFASDKSDSGENYVSESADLNFQKQFFKDKYLEILGFNEGEAKIKITYDQVITPKILMQSKTSPVKIQTADIEKTSSLTMMSGSGTNNWNKTGTYLCDGQYFYVSASLTVNILKRSDDERDFYQLSEYKLNWTANNPLLGSNDANGYCVGTSESAVIKQAGIQYSDLLAGNAANINLSYGPHSLNCNSAWNTSSWSNRAAYAIDRVGALMAYATFHIKTADRVVNGVHEDVHYYNISNFIVGENNYPTAI